MKLHSSMMNIYRKQSLKSIYVERWYDVFFPHQINHSGLMEWCFQNDCGKRKTTPLKGFQLRFNIFVMITRQGRVRSNLNRAESSVNNNWHTPLGAISSSCTAENVFSHTTALYFRNNTRNRQHALFNSHSTTGFLDTKRVSLTWCKNKLVKLD